MIAGNCGKFGSNPALGGIFSGMKCRNVKSILIERAQYRFSDNNGNRLLAKVDYENGRYDLVILKENNLRIVELKNEADRIAKDLIKRKSKVNFADNN